VHCKRGVPLVLEDVKGDSTGDRGDVWVINFGNELHFGR